ncbi:response regulator transcription factor [Nocardioides sp.]|uniref:helix-turn-helix transcriptional regulator n=1 Tax=Nocardioides sp. TaxID=35761 RepID=UPI003516DAA8
MNAQAPLRITLVDDSDLATAGLHTLLAPYGDRVEVVDNRTAIAHPGDLAVVLFEPMGLTGMGESLLRDLIAGGAARTAVFSWADRAQVPSTSPHLSKSMTASQLVRAVEDLATGRFVEPVVEEPPAPVVPVDARPSIPGADVGLTPREAEIVALIVAGMSNREIGDALTLSINSVKTYIRSAYRKMGVERRTQAVLWGLARGMDATGTPALVS